MKHWMLAPLVCAALFGSRIATATTVEWTATGRVVLSTLSDEFLSIYMPGFVGVSVGDEAVLTLRFDTDAELLGELPYEEGGTTYFFDGASVVLELRIDGRGTHVFANDDTVPPDLAGPTATIALDDDTYKYQLEPASAVDAISFNHAYIAPSGVSEFDLYALFGSTNTTIFDGPNLPGSPHPDLAQELAQLMIFEGAQPEVGFLGIRFRDLIAAPSEVPEPGTLGMLGLGLAALGACRRRRSAYASARALPGRIPSGRRG